MKETIYILACIILFNLTCIISTETTAKTVLQEVVENPRINHSIKGKKKTPKKIVLTDDKKGKKKSVSNNPFPDTEKYTVNNMLIKYNSIAKYPVNKKYIKGMKRVGRPLGRACITLSNGVYFIMTYNDYSHMLFIDYQEEAINDLMLVPVVEDMIKTVRPKIKKKKLKKMWKKLRTGDYANVYGKQYKIGGFKINYSSIKLNNNQLRYSMKTEYQL